MTRSWEAKHQGFFATNQTHICAVTCEHIGSLRWAAIEDVMLVGCHSVIGSTI
jgi:hypothetical protein